MDPKEFVNEHCIKSLACYFSGGKDSLVATHYTLSSLEEYDLEQHVVHIDTGVMLPIARPYVEDICQQHGWRLTVLEGHFFELAEKNGMPRMRHRWCCYHCKLKPAIDFMQTLPAPRAEITGLRRDESFRRRDLVQIIDKPRSGSLGFAPILYWTGKDVNNYIKRQGLPVPPNYRLGLKETCMCGVFSSKRQMLILKAQFPELFQKFVDLEAGFRKGGAAFFFRNKPVYARDLARQQTLEAK